MTDRTRTGTALFHKQGCSFTTRSPFKFGCRGTVRTFIAQFQRLVTYFGLVYPAIKTIPRPALPRHGPLYGSGAFLISATEELKWYARSVLPRLHLLGRQRSYF